ncbi:GyrI-like domain-containing protein [Profundibacter sp.]|uniref:GyrI-like domain-containing protein n=1 Tax=Profundibacter sp. TaxID=3101071 RepID=UPI003D132502
MLKTDFKKQDKALYSGKVGRFDLVDVPEMNFLMIDGAGDPNTAPFYGRAVAALYGLSYGVKFYGKPRGVDHVVPPLEGLWWADDMGSFTSRDKDSWKSRMMIRQPDWVGSEDLAEVLENVVAKNTKKKDAPTNEETLRAVRLGRFHEGLAVQVLHVGPYDAEGPVLEEMHKRFILENGYEPCGLHHEVYLGDPRKVAPDKLKTILRQPVSLPK